MIATAELPLTFPAQLRKVQSAGEDFRGKIYVHAAKGMTRGDYLACEICCADIPGAELPPFEVLERGGIVGTVEVVDCVDQDASPWFFGEFGFVLKNAEPLPFRPLKGALGFFNVEGGTL